MNLTFYGAARSVTGSCHCLDIGGKRVLIDCGLQQGRDEIDNGVFPFNAAEIDYVIVTHAHIDHSGRLPLLVKMGFKGDIITTRLTAELLSIMLLDSAHIQESDAMWENQKGKRAGRAQVEPLYTMEDAMNCLKLVKTFDYGNQFEIFDGLKCRFADAGHLLGSALVELWLTEGSVTKKIVFSGDIGNINQPIIRNPTFIKEADYVVTESTYGDRNHEGEGEYTEGLAEILDETFAKGGNVIIPSFAVGRTQELLYFIREIKERGLVKSLPDFEVYVDSPLARQATEVFSGDLTGYLDDEAKALVLGGECMLCFPNLKLTQTTDESRALNLDMKPKVIISASGMCDAGRIRHHLKHNLWRPECSVVFVGYQAVGSFGRMLLEGAEKVKMFGEEIVVRARIVNFKGLSSHAGLEGLKDWISAYDPKPRHVFAVHGDIEVISKYVETLNKMGFEAHAPEYTEVYDLLKNSMVSAGYTPEKPTRGEHGSPVFVDLKKMGEKLLEVIHQNKGGTNKDLKKFTEELEALAKKWDR